MNVEMEYVARVNEFTETDHIPFSKPVLNAPCDDHHFKGCVLSIVPSQTRNFKSIGVTVNFSTPRSYNCHDPSNSERSVI